MESLQGKMTLPTTCLRHRDEKILLYVCMYAPGVCLDSVVLLCSLIHLHLHVQRNAQHCINNAKCNGLWVLGVQLQKNVSCTIPVLVSKKITALLHRYENVLLQFINCLQPFEGCCTVMLINLLPLS